MDEQLIQQQYKEALHKYTKLLEPVKAKEFWQISGIIDVIDDEGGYWDSYNVNIIFTRNYPNDLPILIETSKKILRDVNWHVNENGICCLSTPAVIFHQLGREITLLKWLDKFAHPFLANHVYRKKAGHYAQEEFSHGTEGIIEGWKKILNIDDAMKVLEQLRYRAGNKTLSLNNSCFCGSGKKYKRCYVLNRRDHQLNVPISEIKKNIKTISDYLSKN